MPVAIVADAHLGGLGGPAGPLTHQLNDIAEQGCDRLVLLGDLFHVWVGYPHFETEEISTVVGALRRLRRGGLRIDYVEGNRDFFLNDGLYADAVDAFVSEVSFSSGGKRFLAVHGDGLNDHDRQYLFWRWLSKSAPVRALLRHLPAALAQRFVGSTERRLAQTNFKHKHVLPEQAICRYAERRLAEGYDVLLLGHFHEPRVWQVAGGKVHLLEAWFTSHKVEWF